jgi:DNA-directed RNA polymerase specialized sigma subunit
VLKEIPRSQRYLQRPTLELLFSEFTRHDAKERERLVTDAVELHGYTQKSVADFLHLHYSRISKILSRNNKKKARCKI